MAASLHAQILTDGSVGVTTAVPFLTISPDSRAGGMGDLGIASSPDINSQAHNLSKYAFTKSSGGVSLSYSPWLKNISNDMSLAYLAGYYKINDKQGISASIRYFTLGDFKLTNDNNIPIGEENPYEFAFDVGYYMLLSEHFSGGIALRYIRSSAGLSVENSYPGNAFSTDIGFYYNTNSENIKYGENFSVGMSISNIGSKISYSNGASSHYLPSNIGIGTNYACNFGSLNHLSIGLEFNKLLISNTKNDISIFKEITTSIGTEYVYNEQFAMRAGYFYESPEAGNKQHITIGAGVAIGSLNLDFSYLVAIKENNPLANTLRFTLAFDFGSLKNKA